MHTTDIRKKVTIAAVAGIAAAALAGCQYSSSSDEPKYEYIQTRITERLNQEYAKKVSAKVSTVDCPRLESMLKSGDVFICLADLEGQAVRVQVTMDDDEFKYSTLDLVYDATKIAELTATEISDAVGFPVTLNCGEGVHVIPNKDSFKCTGTDEYGDTRTVKITADLDGSSWEVLEEAPTLPLGGAVR